MKHVRVNRALLKTLLEKMAQDPQYRELAERVSRACVFDQGCAELDRREAVVYHNLNDE